MKKTWRVSAFCMAAVMLGGSFAFPAAAADDVAAQIKAASGEMYSVNTKSLGYTAKGYKDEKELIEKPMTYSCSSTSDGNVLVEENRCIYPAGRATGKAIIFDKNGNQLTWADLGDITDQVYYSEDSGILTVTRGLYTKANFGESAVNAEYASINSSNLLQYSTGTLMVNKVAAVLDDISDPNEPVDNFEGGGAHQLSLINEKGEIILAISEPIELVGFVGGGDDVSYSGYNCNMIFGYYADGLLPFYCGRKLGDTLNDLALNTGADKDGETDMGNGFYTLMKSNKYIFAEHEAGYADLTGKIVIPQKFDQVSSFCEGLAWVGTLVDDSDMWNRVYQYGFIDKSGEYVIEPQFENVGSFSEGLAPAKKDGKWGYIDKTGKFVIEPKYDEWYGGLYGNTLEIGASGFSDGIAQVAVKDGDEPAKWGYINSKGETILPLEYDDAFGTDGTYFSVGKTVDGAVKYGVVDQDGNTVLPFIFEDITAPADGTVYAFYNRELYSFVLSKANLDTGDFDGDSKIGVEDAQNVLKAYVSQIAGNDPRLTDAQKKAADINGDNKIDTADAQLVLLYYVRNTIANNPTEWSELIQK